MSNGWNYFDLSGCILFVIGISLKFLWHNYGDKENPEDVILISCRFILALDLVVWYIRLLHITLIFNRLGPKLIMLRKMLNDLLFFVVIIVVFVLNYGVITHVRAQLLR